MADRRDLAVWRCADTDALDRGRPMRRIVRHERTCQSDLHRTFRSTRTEGCKQRIRTQKQFAAEAAANEWRDEANVLSIDAERRSKIRLAGSDPLVGCPHGQLVAVPRGDGRMGLHHRMGLIGRAVVDIELDRRVREGSGEIARRAVGILFARRLFGGRHLSFQIESAFRSFIDDMDEACCSACLLESFGDDDGDSLMIMINLRATQQCGGVHLAFAKLTGIFSGHDRKHARRSLGGGQIDRCDPALCNGRTDDVAVGLIGHHIVLLICVACKASRLQRSVDTIDRLTDDFELIYRIN